ncbi:hypothetical protein RQP46_010498 [Phenoliferia psychrophenolica]
MSFRLMLCVAATMTASVLAQDISVMRQANCSPNVGTGGKHLRILDPVDGVHGWAPGRADVPGLNVDSDKWDNVGVNDPRFWNLYISQEKDTAGNYKIGSPMDTSRCATGEYRRSTPGLINNQCADITTTPRTENDNSAAWLISCDTCAEDGSAKQCTFFSLGDGQCATISGKSLLHQDCSKEGPFGFRSDDNEDSRKGPEAQYWDITY